ncbi:hypothetical protein OG230_11810 [Streptomyces sp. NBC_00234]|uniref:N,N-dimethylformamidase beta subunit family domain-containing protein n=1 Tax=Streptomyces sp. NBC_00234 TaxID=2903638 RepID=UPI002E2D4BBA|nr:N,N-dimethylformamidase beta subunit family domain-containing protein [Streptomyces sp. NBC_00234]
MSRVSRRTAIGALGLGTAAAAGYGLRDKLIPAQASAVPHDALSGENPVVRENGLSGSRSWELGRQHTRKATDLDPRVQGYASVSSVSPGESVDFHVSVRPAHDFTVAVYRLGHYAGKGARRLATSPRLSGTPQPVPTSDSRNGMISCGWPVSWTLEIPGSWISGAYLAVFTTVDGYRSYTPFVVREPERRSDILVVLPFTTYQAYNLWPEDGRTGKNLYRGFLPNGEVGGFTERAVNVSFDRPYAQFGLPRWFDLDTAFIRWAEAEGYDVTYASSTDLHDGRIDPARHRAIVFPGHDEYWSQAMRDTASKAVAHGTHLAFLAANNVYFRIRLEDSAAGRAHRVIACYKQDSEAYVERAERAERNAEREERTDKWRMLTADGSRAEQGLLGVQFSGILAPPVPLVVDNADHWLWEGTGLRDGDAIPGMVSIEADGYQAGFPQPAGVEQTLLSASPYQDRLGRGARMQNTSVCVDGRGTMVFVAGTFQWPLALHVEGKVDKRIRTATKNLLDRMVR